ncbi:deoxyribonuclease-1-like isoform X1 [Latimeria chalumnae]|uniref:deoxyribonuclease-1-like isoform X1 n=1 Tax=Latimeria chalumnae TaxID=7897 RepID=UPI00313AFE71
MKLAVFFLLFNTAAAVKICAFNIRQFGVPKVSDSKIMKILVKILTRYDITLIQEVRDAKEMAIAKLMLELNRFDNGICSYKHIESEPLGRTDYTEKYVFIYRTDKVWVTASYQYKDKQKGDEDAFSREPFIVRFHSYSTDLRDFVLIPQHTAPKNAVKEIDELYDVFMFMKRKWKTEDIMFLGDFNADCRFMSEASQKKNRLFKDKFHWLITSDVDTTVKESTNCAYDRIVVHGKKLYKSVGNSCKVFNFQESYNLTEEEALKVSDHYPVEVELRGDLTRSSGYQEPVNFLLILVDFIIAVLHMFGP